MKGCIVGLSRRLLLLMLHSLGQHIHLAFQQLALVGVAVAQVIPLEALVVGVEVVRDAAGRCNGYVKRWSPRQSVHEVGKKREEQCSRTL